MHGAQIDIGLARARFHLHGEIRERSGRRAVIEPHRLKLARRLDAVRLLHRVKVLQPLRIVHHAPIGDAGFGELQAGQFIVPQHGGLRGVRLALEQRHHGADRFELVVLVGVELQLHGRRLTGR